MKSLHEESLEYAQYSEEIADRIAKAYRAGANSEWARSQKIKAMIEVLEAHIEHPTKPGYKRHDILDEIKSLKTQLNRLENVLKALPRNDTGSRS
jgi:hypothetical protein